MVVHDFALNIVTCHIIGVFFYKQRFVWKEFNSNSWSVGELWLGFLRYYLEAFDWKSRVVTIRQKAPLTKFEKLWNGKSLAVEGNLQFGNGKIHFYGQ